MSKHESRSSSGFCVLASRIGFIWLILVANIIQLNALMSLSPGRVRQDWAEHLWQWNLDFYVTPLGFSSCSWLCYNNVILSGFIP